MISALAESIPCETETRLRSLRVMHVFGGRVRSGVETSILTLAGGQRQGLGEVVLVPLAEGAFTGEARDLGFTVAPLNKKRRYDVFSIPRLARIIKQHRIDILHSHAVNGSFYACPAGRLAGVRGQVCHFHAPTTESLEDVYRWKLPRVAAYRYHLWLTRWCQRVITVNPALRRDLIRRGAPPEKVVFIPNALDPDDYDHTRAARRALRDELGLPPEVSVVGAVARLSAFKNFPLLLRAAKRLLDAREPVCFVLAGDGPDRPMLEKMAAELGIARDVHFLGWRKDVSRVLSGFDVFVLSSSSEGFGLSMMEAMATGLPIVATDVDGPRVLVEHGETGLLVPSGDAGRMAEAIRSLVHDKDRARRFGQAGRARTERDFTEDRLIESVENVYASILEAH